MLFVVVLEAFDQLGQYRRSTMLNINVFHYTWQFWFYAPSKAYFNLIVDLFVVPLSHFVNWINTDRPPCYTWMLLITCDKSDFMLSPNYTLTWLLTCLLFLWAILSIGSIQTVHHVIHKCCSLHLTNPIICFLQKHTWTHQQASYYESNSLSMTNQIRCFFPATIFDPLSLTQKYSINLIKPDKVQPSSK